MVFFLFRETEVELNAPVVFTLFSIFTALQFTVATLPIALRVIAEAKVCFDRFKTFLLLPEFEMTNVSENVPENYEYAVTLEDYNGAFEIEKKEEKVESKQQCKDKKNKKNTKSKKEPIEENGHVEEPLVKDENDFVQVLYNLNLKIKAGELIGVAGAVGSGKTCLISAITGEMKTMSSKANKVYGRLALVPQQAWIYSGTVRENILFGSYFDENTFNEVIEAAALKQDIDNWPQKDQTEVGERGLTLSGGQKQRISLARALYAVLDDQKTEKTKFIVLLDDPLSAVDASVAKHIFDNGILRLLKDQTVILVTHGMQFLGRCDQVVFMKNGTISESGTYEDLMKAKNDLYNMVSYDQSQKMEKVKEDNTDDDLENDHPVRNRVMSITSKNAENSDLKVVNEEQDQMNAGWSVLLKYYKVGHSFSIFKLDLFEHI